jgi:hypothetical protein
MRVGRVKRRSRPLTGDPCVFATVYCVAVFRDVRLAFARQADCRRRGRSTLSLLGCG